MPNSVKKHLVLAVAMTMPGIAFSQALEEVVVTAQKRAQSLQDVPIAVSALSGDWMKQNNIADLEDVAALVCASGAWAPAGATLPLSNRWACTSMAFTLAVVTSSACPTWM
jgi:hypothetical protein